MPSALIRTRLSKMAFTITGARPRLGSSSIRSVGHAISPRPIAHICCSPPDSVPASCRRRSQSRGNSSKTRATDSALARPGRRSAAAELQILQRPSSSGRAGAPPARARCRARRSPPATARRCAAPSNSIAPRLSGSRPEIALSVVVLPAPFDADERHGLAVPDLERDVADGGDVPVAGLDRAQAGRSVDMLLAQVGLDHPRVAGDRRGRALGDLLAEGQHHDPVGERHHRPHVVLDQQDRRSRAR